MWKLHFPWTLLRRAIGGGTGDRRRSELWQHLDGANENKLANEVRDCTRWYGSWKYTKTWTNKPLFPTRGPFPVLRGCGGFCIIWAHESSGHALFLNLITSFCLTFSSGKWYFSNAAASYTLLHHQNLETQQLHLLRKLISLCVKNLFYLLLMTDNKLLTSPENKGTISCWYVLY